MTKYWKLAALIFAIIIFFSLGVFQYQSSKKNHKSVEEKQASALSGPATNEAEDSDKGTPCEMTDGHGTTIQFFDTSDSDITIDGKEFKNIPGPEDVIKDDFDYNFTRSYEGTGVKISLQCNRRLEPYKCTQPDPMDEHCEAPVFRCSGQRIEGNHITPWQELVGRCKVD